VTAAPVLVETGGTEAGWLAARRQGITASEIAVVMGLSPYDSPFALYHRKRGDLPEIGDTEILERGRVLEPYIVKKVRQRPEFEPYDIMGDGRQLYAHRDRPWQLATPDRLLTETWFEPVDTAELVEEVTGPVAVLECKTDAGSDDWGDEGTDQIPVHYRCQVLWQMDVLSVEAAYVAMLPLRSWKLRVYELEMDDRAQADLQLMRDEAALFLKSIDYGKPPDVDWRPQTTAALKYLNPKVEQRDVTVGRRLAISYRAAVRRHAAAERRKELMTNRMLAAIGDGRRAIEAGTDEVVATRSVYPNRRIDTRALRAAHPDAAAECTVTRDVTKLLPAKTKDTTS
jgi:putative phage-type endonuclease